MFNYIDRELQAIENDLPAPGQNEYGRADQGALWMLQAKLYLNAEVYAGANRYSDCVAACKKVIDSDVYSLEEDYRQLFMTDNNLSKEIIFPITFDGLSTQTWGGTTYLVHAALCGKMVDNLDDQTGTAYPDKDEAARRFGVNSGWFGLRATSAFGCPNTPAPKTIAPAAANLTQACEDFTVSSKSFAPRPPETSCPPGYDGRLAFDVPTVGRVDGHLVNKKQTEDFQSQSVTWHAKMHDPHHTA